MTLAEVEGDFAVLVDVMGKLDAGSKLPADWQAGNIPFTFQGAGLLVYQDKDNFVRLERTAGVAISTLQPIRKVLLEGVKDGKYIADQVYLPVPDGPVSLLLMRKKGRLIIGASTVPGSPASPLKQIDLDLPAKLKVGLSASNISARPFMATFEHFNIINDLTTLPAAFAEPAP
jgi:hypothetical protein